MVLACGSLSLLGVLGLGYLRSTIVARKARQKSDSDRPCKYHSLGRMKPFDRVLRSARRPQVWVSCESTSIFDFRVTWKDQHKDPFGRGLRPGVGLCHCLCITRRSPEDPRRSGGETFSSVLCSDGYSNPLGASAASETETVLGALRAFQVQAAAATAAYASWMRSETRRSRARVGQSDRTGRLWRRPSARRPTSRCATPRPRHGP